MKQTFLSSDKQEIQANKNVQLPSYFRLLSIRLFVLVFSFLLISWMFFIIWFRILFATNILVVFLIFSSNQIIMFLKGNEVICKYDKRFVFVLNF